MTSFHQAAGKAVRDARKKLNMTQQTFADLFNATDPTSLQTTRGDIAKYETGITVPPGDKLLKFISLAS